MGLTRWVERREWVFKTSSCPSISWYGCSRQYGHASTSVYPEIFAWRKKFAFFTQARRGRKFFRRIVLPSEKFVKLKSLHAQVFIRGCQAVLVVPYDHQSAVLPGVQNLCLDLQPSLMSLLLHLGYCPILRDPCTKGKFLICESFLAVPRGTFMPILPCCTARKALMPVTSA